jgi:hypothetical protein
MTGLVYTVCRVWVEQSVEVFRTPALRVLHQRRRLVAQRASSWAPPPVDEIPRRLPEPPSLSPASPLERACGILCTGRKWVRLDRLGISGPTCRNRLRGLIIGVKYASTNGGLLLHFLQYKVLDCLHCRSELLQVELHVALRDVARAVVQ